MLMLPCFTTQTEHISSNCSVITVHAWLMKCAHPMMLLIIVCHPFNSHALLLSWAFDAVECTNVMSYHLLNVCRGPVPHQLPHLPSCAMHASL